jgi:hypothetical protein
MFPSDDLAQLFTDTSALAPQAIPGVTTPSAAYLPPSIDIASAFPSAAQPAAPAAQQAHQPGFLSALGNLFMGKAPGQTGQAASGGSFTGNSVADGLRRIMGIALGQPAAKQPAAAAAPASGQQQPGAAAPTANGQQPANMDALVQLIRQLFGGARGVDLNLPVPGASSNTAAKPAQSAAPPPAAPTPAPPAGNDEEDETEDD